MANVLIRKSIALKVLQYSILFLVVYQSLHVLDHILQYYELYVLGINPPPAIFEGLFNASDTKVHLWLNMIEHATFILILTSLYLTYRYLRRVRGYVRKSIALKVLQYSILFLVIYQSLHVLDHILQYYELYVLGINPPPAIFEGLFNESDTKIHLWINGILIVSSFVVLITFMKSKAILSYLPPNN
ncbi:MAG: hypothetical protein E6L03_01280 [Thaumarchaeota archaeon]|nr:MAG: hypothetical protein E6L03_01280 [Nitrososphaerota archaeon]